MRHVVISTRSILLGWHCLGKSGMTLFGKCAPRVDARLHITGQRIHGVNPIFIGERANAREAVLAARGFLRSEWVCSSRRKYIRRSRT
jgi:hypothetical protein